MSAEIVLQEKFVAFGAGHQSVAAPDEPDPRPVFFRAGILNRKLKLFVLQLIDDMPDDLFVRLRSVRGSILDYLGVRLVKLRIERKPTATDRLRLDINSMTTGDASAAIHCGVLLRHRRVISKLAFIAPLLAVDVMPRRGILQT